MSKLNYEELEIALKAEQALSTRYATHIIEGTSDVFLKQRIAELETELAAAKKQLGVQAIFEEGYKFNRFLTSGIDHDGQLFVDYRFTKEKSQAEPYKHQDPYFNDPHQEPIYKVTSQAEK